MNQTAVEWLMRKYEKNGYLMETDFIEAKEMEKNISEKYGQFCVLRREAKLSYVDFNKWMYYNKLTFKSE